MSITSQLISQIVEIVLINLVLSGDNVAVISLSVKNLPPKKAKLANMIGVCMALLLRIFFISVIGYIFKFKWLHVHLIGGIILIYITVNMMKTNDEKAVITKESSDGFSKALISIIISDISMSLDNVLAITSVIINDVGEITGQQMILVVLAILICVPIIFLGSEIVSKLMSKYPIIIYICAALLIYTAIKMILKDSFVLHILSIINPLLILIAIGVIAITTVIFMSKEA
ncbi:YjbE family putative metal transport protein [Clostridium paridis]|uniref:YjbE family putative metal transport protein n=1 Tax=Clostridium paridis TaxID=2803863 RepID=A0A937FEQ3_9CLOT|nr:YjbE family putative metal transport protein [Clostridium paridis]MBL4931969.1 YjbE family putative metal transport protein [Clostridium paridis]